MKLRKPRHARKTEDIFEGLPHTLNKQDAWVESLRFDGAEKENPARIIVRIERWGIRLLDPDNLVGGVKGTVDALRYAGLIPQDDPTAIQLIVTQKKVKKKDVGTLIELERL